MKRILFSLFFSLIACFAFSHEYIKNYDIDIRIESDGNLLITEKITAQVEGNIIRRGLMRDFPTRYEDRFGNTYVVGFEVLSVKRNGEAEPWHTKRRMNGVEIYTGHEDVFLSHALHTFEITYRTSHQIGFFENHDELYFNAIGGGWAFSIANYTLNVHLPKTAEMIEHAVYSGAFGSTTCSCSVESTDSTLFVSSNGSLNPGEQLTFVVSWNKGVIAEPTTWEKYLWFFQSNLNFVIALFGLLLVFSIYHRRWSKYGRDPKKGTIIPLFDPPHAYSPAVVGFLYRTKMRSTLVSATLVNMAIKGVLKIKQTKKSWGTTYTLEQLTTNAVALSEEEKAIFHILFNRRQQVELSNKNHSIFQSVTTRVEGEIEKKADKKYYNNNIGKMVLPGVLSFVFIVLTFFAGTNIWVAGALFVALAILFALFHFLIPAPTVEGRKLMDEIEGFRMYLVTAESRFLNDAHKPDLTVERFEALLPYAIALGVENEWGKKFSNHLKTSSLESNSNYNPIWYSGMLGAAVFRPDAFTRSFGSSFSSSISSSSTPPGSSSGSGGGGFSGGGGGGGGGGGW